MTLPIPFPIYGYTKDSNGDIIPNLGITVSGQSIVTTESDANGKYLINIQNLVSEGEKLTIYASYLGEHTQVDWIVSLTPPAKQIDIELQDSTTAGEVTLNAYRSFGNSAYIYTSTDVNSYLKISDLNWKL